MRTAVPWSLRRARHLIAISEFTKREIIDLFQLPPERISVTHLAARPAFRILANPAALAGVRAKYGLRDPFILCVGTVEPRKNLTRVVEAFARVRQGGLPHVLVLAGQTYFAAKDIMATINRLHLEPYVTLVGYVPDEDLPALYNSADLFVYPSLYEGFGIPVLEAMACGTPVVASNATSIPEVAGTAALLVDPRDVTALADAMVRALTDPDLRKWLHGAGIDRARQFSWDQTAAATVAVYRSIRAEDDA
jgi:glycosyltransferase involved in cell wall biosynthesis